MPLLLEQMIVFFRDSATLSHMAEYSNAITGRSLQMASTALEKRVAALEDELAKLRVKVEQAEPVKPWWEQIAGTIEKDPVYKQAMKIGREYRQSLNPAKSSRKGK